MHTVALRHVVHALPLAASSQRSSCIHLNRGFAALCFRRKGGGTHRRCLRTATVYTERSMRRGGCPPAAVPVTGRPLDLGNRRLLRALTARPAAPGGVCAPRARAPPGSLPLRRGRLRGGRRARARTWRQRMRRRWQPPGARLHQGERGALARQPRRHRRAALRQRGRGGGAAARLGGSGRGAAARTQAAPGGGRAGPGVLRAGGCGARAGGLRLGARRLALPRVRERVGLQRAAGRAGGRCSIALRFGWSPAPRLTAQAMRLTRRVDLTGMHGLVHWHVAFAARCTAGQHCAQSVAGMCLYPQL